MTEQRTEHKLPSGGTIVFAPGQSESLPWIAIRNDGVRLNRYPTQEAAQAALAAHRVERSQSKPAAPVRCGICRSKNHTQAECPSRKSVMTEEHREALRRKKEREMPVIKMVGITIKDPLPPVLVDRPTPRYDGDDGDDLEEAARVGPMELGLLISNLRAAEEHARVCRAKVEAELAKRAAEVQALREALREKE